MLNARLVLILVLALAGAALPAAAEPPESRWTLTVSVVGLSPTGDDARAIVPAGESRFDVSSGEGFGLALDYQLTQRWGVGLTMRSASLGSRFHLSTPDRSLIADDSMRFELFGLAGSYRFLRRDRFDLYVEGAVVMSKGADQIFTTGPASQVKLTFDDDFGYELTLGADARLGASNWILRGGLGYLVTILETDSGFEDMDLDPWSLGIGIGYRF